MTTITLQVRQCRSQQPLIAAAHALELAVDELQRNARSPARS